MGFKNRNPINDMPILYQERNCIRILAVKTSRENLNECKYLYVDVPIKELVRDNISDLITKNLAFSGAEEHELFYSPLFGEDCGVSKKQIISLLHLIENRIGKRKVEIPSDDTLKYKQEINSFVINLNKKNDAFIRATKIGEIDISKKEETKKEIKNEPIKNQFIEIEESKTKKENGVRDTIWLLSFLGVGILLFYFIFFYKG